MQCLLKSAPPPLTKILTVLGRQLHQVCSQMRRYETNGVFRCHITISQPPCREDLLHGYIWLVHYQLCTAWRPCMFSCMSWVVSALWCIACISVFCSNILINSDQILTCIIKWQIMFFFSLSPPPFLLIWSKSHKNRIGLFNILWYISIHIRIHLRCIYFPKLAFQGTVDLTSYLTT